MVNGLTLSFFIIKPAGHPHARLKARPGEVDHRAPQHVPVLGGEHQRQIGPDQVPQILGNCKKILYGNTENIEY